MMKIYLLKQLMTWSSSLVNVRILHLIILGILFLINCTSTHPTHHDNLDPAGVHFSPSSYMLEDMGHKIHRYKDNIQILHLPLQNPKLTQYCMKHYRWEDIHVLRKLRPTPPGLKSQRKPRRPLLIIQYRVIPHKK